MIAAFDSFLIFLVFIAISAVSTWLQKRREAQEQGEASPDETAPQPTPGPPGRATPPERSGVPGAPRPERPRSPLQSWEEELRRLLEGEQPAPASPPIPKVSTPPELPAKSERRPSPTARQTAPTHRLEDSQQAYQRARRQQAEAAARLREAQAKTVKHLGGSRRRPRMVAAGNDIGDARALVSNPRAARQAIIASVILGSPKAFD